MSNKLHDTTHHKILRESHPFKYLDATHFEQLQKYGQFLSFTNEVIIQQGQKGPGLFVLLEGNVSVSVNALGQGNVELAQISKGHVFGDVSLLQNAACTSTVRAKESAICFFLARSYYDAFDILMPEIRYFINKSLIEDVVERHRALAQDMVPLIENHKKMKNHLQTHRSCTIIPWTIRQKLKQYNYLHHLPLFNTFTINDFKTLLKNTTLLEAPKGYHLIQKNQQGNPCFFIVSGSVHANMVLDSHHSRFAVYGPNTLICPLSFIDKKQEVFDYITIDPATILQINNDFLEAESKKRTLLWFKCFDLFCKYIVSLQIKLNNQMVRLNYETIETIVKE